MEPILLVFSEENNTYSYMPSDHNNHMIQTVRLMPMTNEIRLYTLMQSFLLNLPYLHKINNYHELRSENVIKAVCF